MLWCHVEVLQVARTDGLHKCNGLRAMLPDVLIQPPISLEHLGGTSKSSW